MATSVQERLNSRTYVQDGHLLWGGALDVGSYGVIRVGGRLQQQVHRVAWETAYGAIPEEVQVNHSCDTPPCILPWHLYLGTQADNMADMARAGSHRNSIKTRCPQGHPYDEENTYLRGTRRTCRTCRRERQQRWRETGSYGYAKTSQQARARTYTSSPALHR
ncbi:hypothetical protein LCGC14_1782790 [marine sediment metagenome]|uniref:HNH nuclease domain-containing protein n=1 Tax=marine sediment metagenome TaxID=412755 RepID=A0A0F9JUG1_9ZZZZ